MIERFLKQTHFTSEQDFKEHLEFIIPEDFNFAYDVMDEWAKSSQTMLHCFGQVNVARRYVLPIKT